MRNKIFVTALALLLVPALAMLGMSAMPANVEAGAAATWEGSASASKCFIYMDDETGERNGGYTYGNGPENGGYVSMDSCRDILEAGNVCSENIDNDFDCVLQGSARNCNDPCPS